jgi:hypothetical protein
MSIVLTNERAGVPPLPLSNGLASVLFDVLAMAAGALAQTAWQQALALWIAQHDTNRVGNGCNDLDVEDMNFPAADFAAARAFALQVVDRAHGGEDWPLLPYAPDRQRLQEALQGLRGLIAAFEPRHRRELDDRAFAVGEVPQDGQCARHRAYLHELGCIVCGSVEPS